LVVVGSASAFECYNASRSARGNEAAARAPALASFEEILGEEVGLCPEGIEHVIAGVEAEGFKTDSLINFRTLMAGGLEKNGKGGELLHNGKGIDHLGEEFFAVADPLVGEGFEICAEGD
jgi:hypothetical protein